MWCSPLAAPDVDEQAFPTRASAVKQETAPSWPYTQPLMGSADASCSTVPAAIKRLLRQALRKSPVAESVPLVLSIWESGRAAASQTTVTYASSTSAHADS